MESIKHPTREEVAMGNPYHQPETAKAIWIVVNGTGIIQSEANALARLLPIAYRATALPKLTVERSLEIVLSRVRMDNQMRKCLMAALTLHRGNRVRQAQYSGVGDLDAGIPNHDDPSKRGFNPK